MVEETDLNHDIYSLDCISNYFNKKLRKSKKLSMVQKVLIISLYLYWFL